MNYDREDRALLFGLGFWLCVFAAFLWWAFIRPSDLRLIIPTYWWVDWCAISPGTVFLFESCVADSQVGDTDSLAAAFVTMFAILMLWLVQFGILAAIPVVAYACTERIFIDD